MYSCRYCDFRCQAQRRFLRHLRRHAEDDGFQVDCYQCGKVFKKLTQYSNHLYWHTVKNKRDQPSTLSSFAAVGEHDHSTGVEEELEHPMTESSDDEPDAATSFLDRSNASCSVYKRSWVDVADFILSLQTQGVPKRVCETIVGEFKKFGAQVESEVAGSIAGKDKAQSEVVRGLNNIDTAHKVSQFAIHERGCIPPQAQLIGDKSVSQYVPIDEQLRAVLQCPEAFEDLDFDHSERSGKYRHLCDGSLHRNARGSLQIILYYDEFTIVNPIGGKASKWSIGAIYYAIANRSNSSILSNIYLAMLFRSNDVKTRSWKEVLTPLVKDLIKLETEGLVFRRNGAMDTIRAVLSVIVGDNKGSHQLAGYFTAFHGTNRICRLCHARTAEIQKRFKESEFVMRTCKEYDSEMRLLEMEDFCPEMQKLFALREACQFNQVPSFHCVLGFPLDVTHDLFEKGVITRTLGVVLARCFKDGDWSLGDANDSIRCFPFHKTDLNRPQPLKKDNKGCLKMSQTCSET